MANIFDQFDSAGAAPATAPAPAPAATASSPSPASGIGYSTAAPPPGSAVPTGAPPVSGNVFDQFDDQGGNAATASGAPPQPSSTITTLAESPFVGFNKGIAGVLGAPVDAANWALGHLDPRTMFNPGQTAQPMVQNPIGGSQWIDQNVLGAIGANPETHQPRSAAERMLQSAGQGAASMMLPEAGVSAMMPKLATAAPQTADFLANAFGASKTIPSALANAGVGASAGFGSAAANELPIPDQWKPLASMAGGILGGIGGAGVAAIPSVARSGINAASKFIQPMTKTGAEAIAGSQLATAAGGKDALLNALEDSQGQLIPGSTPTLAEQVQIPGISALQHQVETQNGVPFQERRAAQSQARVGALTNIQPTGSPEDVANLLREHLADLDQRAEGAVAQRVGEAQNATGELGGTQSPEYYGAQISGQVQPQVDAAVAAAKAANQGLGAYATPEQIGSTMREGAATAADEARQQRNGVYNAIDPEGKLNIVQTPVVAMRNKILQGINEMERPPSGEEAAIYSAIGNSDVIPFNSLRALDSRVTAAMSEEMRQAGRSPAWGRLSQLKGAISDAIGNAVENQVAYERAAVARREMMPAQTVEARLNGIMSGGATGTDGPFGGFRGAPDLAGAPTSFGNAPPSVNEPQSLVAFLRQRGGIKDQGGELSARNTHTQFPGLVNNRTGMTLDHAREAAAEAGYLGANTDHAMGQTGIDTFLDALDSHPVYSIHDTDQLAASQERGEWRADQRRYKAARDEILGNLNAPGAKDADPELVHDAATLMVNHGMGWDDALERAAVDLENHRAEDLYYAAFSNRAPQGETTARGAGAFQDRGGKGIPPQSGASSGFSGESGAVSSLEPNFDPAAAERLDLAKQTHAAYAQTYKQGPVGNMLRTNGFAGQYKLIDSGVPDTVFAKGPKGYETAMAFRQAAKDAPAAVGALRNYAAMTLRRIAEKPDGTLDPAKFTAWKSSYGDALRAIPELRQQFSTVQKASQELDRFAPFRKDLAPSAVPEMFFHSGVSGAGDVRQLRGLVGDEKATSILSDYAASRLKQAATRQDGTLDPAITATWLKQHQSALSELPGLADRFATTAKATQAIDEASAARKAAINAYQQGAVGKLLGVSEPADVTRTIGNIFSHNNAVGEMRRVAQLAKGNPDAEQGLRKAIVDHIYNSFVGNTENIKSDAFQTFLRKNKDALGTVFKPEEIKSMEAVATDLARTRIAAEQAKIPGQSNSTPDFLAAKKAEQKHSSLIDKLWKGVVTGGEAGPHGAFLGAGVAIGSHVLGAMRQAGFRTSGDLVKAALLNETGDGALAKSLVMKASNKPNAGSEVTLAHQLRRIAVINTPRMDGKR